MAKPNILILAVLAFLSCIASTPVQAGWWNNDQENQHLQDQLYQAQDQNNGEGVAIVVLAVGVVIALGIGAAVGSRARRAAKSHE